MNGWQPEQRRLVMTSILLLFGFPHRRTAQLATDCRRQSLMTAAALRRHDAVPDVLMMLPLQKGHQQQRRFDPYAAATNSVLFGTRAWAPPQENSPAATDMKGASEGRLRQASGFQPRSVFTAIPAAAQGMQHKPRSAAAHFRIWVRRTLAPAHIDGSWLHKGW